MAAWVHGCMGMETQGFNIYMDKWTLFFPCYIYIFKRLIIKGMGGGEYNRYIKGN